MTTATDNYTGVTLKSLLENPNLLIPPRCKDEDKKEGWSDNMDASSAFLGPTLWDKTLPYDGNDFKLEYMDLDEFLSENGIPISTEENKVSSTTESKLEKDDSQSSQSSHDDFDPRKRAFSEEELKPQPMIKKSKKQFVPEELKDEKYWARRGKNNMAAKRSRDARRVKENQIAIRASYLEKENDTLKLQLENLSKENQVLKDKLAKLENSSH